MHKKLMIIGASGHGKVVADVAKEIHKYEEICFLDDNELRETCVGYSIVGNVKDAKHYIDKADFFVAIGNADVRKKIMIQLLDNNANFATLIHPKACIGSRVMIGKGTVVMAGAIINAESVIGEGCIINTCASVDHDCSLGDYVHIAVGAHLCGTVSIKEETWVGAGATVKENINICNKCMIGAGAVVIKNLEIPGIYVGVPAKRLDDK